MGEVRVRVRLYNAADRCLVRAGRMRPDEMRAYEADAMVDTGAVCLIIPPHVCRVLGLGTEGERLVELADGRKERAPRTEPLLIELLQRDTFDEALVMGDEVLVGQTVLEKTDLHVDCLNRRLVPNPGHPDQPVLKAK